MAGWRVCWDEKAPVRRQTASATNREIRLDKAALTATAAPAIRARTRHAVGDNARSPAVARAPAAIRAVAEAAPGAAPKTPRAKGRTTATSLRIHAATPAATRKRRTTSRP